MSDLKPQQGNLPQKNEDRAVVFQAGGQEVTLTATTVMKYFARGNENVTEQEIILFMNWCKFQELNPWTNEAYLVKYDAKKPAQNITGKEAFMKRAEDDPRYEGLKAGLILGRDGEVVEVEGSFMLKTDTLLGGWCDVYRSDRKFPISARVNLEEYHKGQSTWNQMPKTMIRKVAIVQALREAFPKNLGNLYVDDEFQDVEVMDSENEVEKEIEDKANKKAVRFEPDIKPAQQQQQTATVYAYEGSGQVGMAGPEF